MTDLFFLPHPSRLGEIKPSHRVMEQVTHCRGRLSEELETEVTALDKQAAVNPETVYQ